MERHIKSYCTVIMVLILLVPTTFGQKVNESLLRARALMYYSETEEAISVLSVAIEKNKSASLYIERANAYLLLKDTDNAIKDLLIANELERGVGDYLLARIYANRGEVVTSLDYLEKSMSTPYKKQEKELMLDDSFTRISASEEWKEFIRKNWYSKIETAISEIDYYLSLGKTMDAIVLLNELTGEYPENQEVIFSEAKLDISTGKYQDAILILNDLVREYPQNFPYSRLLAEAKFLDGNYSGSAILYKDLIDRGDADADIYFGLAESLYNMGEYSSALDNIDIFLSLYYNDSKALRLAGNIERASGNYLNALKYFSQRLEYNTSDSRCFVDRAETYFMARSWELAINDYGMALDLDPDDADSWLNKGLSHIYIKQYDLGCFCLGEADKKGSVKASSWIQHYCD